MRLHVVTSESESIVPYNYQPMLTGALHKWLSNNNIHDGLSLYSFSWLQKGEATKSGLSFNNGAKFFISSPNKEMIKLLIDGIHRSPDIAFGMKVKEIIIQEDPVFNSAHKFFFASPILIKRRIGDKEVHYTFKDKESSTFMTETLKRKLRVAGMNDQSLSVQFDNSYKDAKTKLIHYNNIGNKVNLCPVVISGSSEQLAFAWNVGVGNSTGIGFGSLK